MPHLDRTRTFHRVNQVVETLRVPGITALMEYVNTTHQGQLALLALNIQQMQLARHTALDRLAGIVRRTMFADITHPPQPEPHLVPTQLRLYALIIALSSPFPRSQ